MTLHDAIGKHRSRRIVAAYKLRLAEKALGIGARPETWGRGQTISEEAEKRYLTAEDKFRISPYPFPGLRSFDPEEGELFFGRERNVEALRSILAKRRLVVVLGGSGSGKSSLIRAGLLPFLNSERRIKGRDGNWYASEFRPRTDPLGELSAALVNQLLRPLLRLRRNGLAKAMDLDADTDCEAESTIKLLHDRMRQRFMEAKSGGRQQVLNTLLEIVDKQLESYDDIVTQGRRLAEPNLFLLIDQLEEVFRPEIAHDEREALLNLIVDLHNRMQNTSLKSGLFLAATIRSEEVHRCAEHRGLSEVVIGSGYQLELLDVDEQEDANGLRRAIVQPARNVFEDWGLAEHLDHADAPFEKGMPDLLLTGAARLATEIDHRPDQLPLLQHALQATWHSAMRRWSNPSFATERLEITRQDLPGQIEGWTVPEFSACLKSRADKAEQRAAQRFAEIVGVDVAAGTQAVRAAFRALARRDDQGNWTRRFAGRDEMTAFLVADPLSAVARLPDDQRWNALQNSLQVFLLRGYLSGSSEQKYDISHEALIRNWPLFQRWLRAPEEVAYALGRVLIEVDPETFMAASAEKKIELIPDKLAAQVAQVAEGGALPTSWGEDQIAPYLLRPGLRRLWGGEKRKALQRLTDLAAISDKLRREAATAALAAARTATEEETRRRFYKYLSAGAGVFLIASGIVAYRIQVARVKQAAAYSLIGSMQYQTNWPDGLRERAAIQAERMLNGGGRSPNPDVLRDTAWSNWDTGVRYILGEQLRIASLDKLPATTSQPACLTYYEASSPKGTDSVSTASHSVPLTGALKTEIRLTAATGSDHVFFETSNNGGKWISAIQDNPMPVPTPVPAGTRLCLAPNGSAVTISYRGSSLPNMLELYWHTCGGGSSCSDDAWHVGWRQIGWSSASAKGPFSCVRAVTVSPHSDQNLSHIDVDFTDETPEACDPARTSSSIAQPKVQSFRGSYVAGIAEAILVSRPEKPTKFTDCKGDTSQRECQLPNNSTSKLIMNRIPNTVDYWSISIYPVDERYPIKNVVLVAPTIAKVAVDDRGDIWLSDGKDHFWILINDRDAMIRELWHRAMSLMQTPNWYDKFPEIRMDMTDDDLKSQGPN
jgi:hypothetical protein